ncbi:hypothetical protein DBP18_21970 [Streptomyces sp. CS081A]|nr:hypothetical protein DBP18_21970 [Streptomyces sp. CS081A]
MPPPGTVHASARTATAGPDTLRTATAGAGRAPARTTTLGTAGVRADRDLAPSSAGPADRPSRGTRAHRTEARRGPS